MDGINGLNSATNTSQLRANTQPTKAANTNNMQNQTPPPPPPPPPPERQSSNDMGLNINLTA